MNAGSQAGARGPRPTPEAADGAEPFQQVLGRFFAQAGSLLSGHFELFRVELGDERERIGQMLTRGLLTAFMISLTLQLTAALIIALAWDTPWRIHVIVGLVLVALISTVLMIRAYKGGRRSSPFAASVQELDRSVHGTSAWNADPAPSSPMRPPSS